VYHSPQTPSLPRSSHPQASRPYLDALLSPAAISLDGETGKRHRRARSLPPISTRCFRCLSSDHQIAERRDPVRCRTCMRIGHRSFACANGANTRHSPRFPREPASWVTLLDTPAAWQHTSRSEWCSPTADHTSFGVRCGANALDRALLQSCSASSSHRARESTC
jgi:hypothetical protein